MNDVDTKATRLEAIRLVQEDADRVAHAMREGDTLEEALNAVADDPAHVRLVRAEVLRRLGVRPSSFPVRM